MILNKRFSRPIERGHVNRLSLILTFISASLFAGNIDKATFAGGCFWCMEKPFDTQKGVIKTISGYTGGNTKNPTYKDISGGKTGHVEAVEVHFDRTKVSYKKLLSIFWRQIDPTDSGGQFVDRGSQYLAAIFYHNNEQEIQAKASLKDLIASKRFKRPIVTKILPASKFYIAEEYHQNYYKKNPIRYKLYRLGSGRDKFLKIHWK